jgi:hypothetical protein
VPPPQLLFAWQTGMKKPVHPVVPIRTIAANNALPIHAFLEFISD